MRWHLLQVSDVLDIEFGAALAEQVELIAWKPRRTVSPIAALVGSEGEHLHTSPPLRTRSFPVLRGFARPPLTLFPTHRILLRRLLRQSPSPESTTLLCTVPYFAPVAELWPGPVVYWLTDLIAAYTGANRAQVESLDRRMCRVATLVCPNSARLAAYLQDAAGCPPDRLHIVPNATRAANLLPVVPTGPRALPDDVADLPRPVAGVIGNLAGNMDWEFLEGLLARQPDVSFLFVGPTTMEIPDQAQQDARHRVMQHPKARFIGPRPYGDLAAYARSFDVALLPYRRLEPTYSGSSTRFYEHLAACRPMLATRGFEELLRKEPLLTLVDTPEQASTAMDALRASNFNDGFLEARWNASRDGTWHARVSSLVSALSERLHH